MRGTEPQGAVRKASKTLTQCTKGYMSLCFLWWLRLPYLLWHSTAPLFLGLVGASSKCSDHEPSIGVTLQLWFCAFFPLDLTHTIKERKNCHINPSIIDHEFVETSKGSAASSPIRAYCVAEGRTNVFPDRETASEDCVDDT